MPLLLTLFNEIPTRSVYNLKQKPLPLLVVSHDGSASVRKAALLSRFFSNLSRPTPHDYSYSHILSTAQFNFFKTISSSLEISLIGSNTYSVLHACKYDDTLPLNGFKNDTSFFMRLPNLLLLLFNSVFDTSLGIINGVHRNRLVSYNTRTLVLNFISLGNTKLGTVQLSSLRLVEQTNTAFFNKLSGYGVNDYFSRLEVSKDLVSKVHNLLLDTSTLGIF